jgi:serine/threonine protein kinase/tetratricopeptide (TPR) repeat protein
MSSKLFKEKQKERIKLHEVCGNCGKVKDKTLTGSITARIFGAKVCACESAHPLNAYPLAERKKNIDFSDKPESSIANDSDRTEKISASVGDRYELLEVIGQGGMGTVYRAKDKILGKEFAIKVLRDELATDESAIKRFEQEAKSASELTHANMLAVYDHGRTTSGAPFIVMDLLEGESLAQLLKRETRLDPSRVMNISSQVCDALAHAHMKGLVHRDLKPSNIMLVNNELSTDSVKVLDFGIAKLMPSSNRETQNLTQTGELFGSPSYMSPEQCLGCNLDARSDVYSLGCMMYEMLTGKPPFAGKNPIQTVVKHLNEAPPPIGKLLPAAKLPGGLESIVMCCLEKDPEARYQSMDRVRADLQLICSGQVPKQPKKPAAKSAKSISPTTLVFATIGALALIGAAPSPFLPLICFLLLTVLVGKSLKQQFKRNNAETRTALAFWKTSTLLFLFVFMVMFVLMLAMSFMSDLHLNLPATQSSLMLLIGLLCMGLLVSPLMALASAIAWGFYKVISFFNLSPRASKHLNIGLLVVLMCTLTVARPQVAYVPYFFASFLDAAQLAKSDGPPEMKKLKPNPFYDVAIFLDPELAQAYYNRASQRSSIDPQGAISDFTKVIELNPKPGLFRWVTPALALKDRAELYSRTGNNEQAIMDVTKAISLEPEDSVLYENRAYYYEKLHQYQKARDDYTRAIANNASSSWAYGRRGSLEERLDNDKQALSDYSSAIELDPNSYKFYFRRAALYKKLGEKFKALRDYEKLTLISPFETSKWDGGKRGETEYYIALAYKELRQMKEARQYFQWAARDGYKPDTGTEADAE